AGELAAGTRSGPAPVARPVRDPAAPPPRRGLSEPRRREAHGEKITRRHRAQAGELAGLNRGAATRMKGTLRACTGMMRGLRTELLRYEHDETERLEVGFRVWVGSHGQGAERS